MSIEPETRVRLHSDRYVNIRKGDTGTILTIDARGWAHVLWNRVGKILRVSTRDIHPITALDLMVEALETPKWPEPSK